MRRIRSTESMSQTDDPLNLSIVIPAYNEEKRLGQTIPKVVAYAQRRRGRFEIIVVDDGSQDGTSRTTQELAARYPTVRLITLSRNRGKGAAVKAGVLEASGSYVVFIDADLSIPIIELDKLLERHERGISDIAIGSRWVEGAEIELPQRWIRRIAGRLFSLATKCVAIRGIADTQCGFKSMTRDAAQKIFPWMTSPTAIFDVEMLMIATQKGFRISEVPVKCSHEPETRIPLNIRYAVRMFLELFRIRRAQKVRWPLKAKMV